MNREKWRKLNMKNIKEKTSDYVNGALLGNNQGLQ